VFQSTLSGVTDLPTPKNISWFWLWGSMLGISVGVQVFSGYLISCYYNSSTLEAFRCVDLIKRDVAAGSIFRHLHVFGASVIFLFLFLHMARGLFFFSFCHNAFAWKRGVLLYVLMMATSFFGYVLPWAQMSFWAATVITNFVTVIPFVGGSMVVWVWGRFSVESPTLVRFYSLHFLLPSLIILFALLHIVLLHSTGSSNPTGLDSSGSNIRFSTFSSVKDAFGFICVFFALFSLYCFKPMVVTDYEQAIEANPFVTPLHIVPEWYFLPVYAVVRSVPKKLGGVVCLVLFVAILFIFPLVCPKRSKVSSVSIFLFFWFIVSFLFLLFLGGQVAEQPFITLSQIFRGLYFLYFFTISLVLNIQGSNVSSDVC
jgi:ubiquinol-cytochrome c reductase cytochrome b subunit